MVGGALGWLAGIGALAIPGVGPLLAAGPILAALSAAALGAAVGGLAGGLIGLGIPELEAKRYEGKILAGNILLSVHTEDWNEVKAVEDISGNRAGKTFVSAVKPMFPRGNTRPTRSKSERGGAPQDELYPRLL